MSEVRRSSRANKGQNTRLLKEQQELEEALRIAEQEAEEERQKTEEDHVLCLVCGTTDSNYDEDDARDMIQCDKCKTWQHNECMLKDPAKVPKRYLCNLCDANNKHYAKLKYKMDPEATREWLEKDDLRKKRKQESLQRLLEDLDDIKKTKELRNGDNDEEDDLVSGNSSEDEEDGADDDDDAVEDDDLNFEVKKEHSKTIVSRKRTSSEKSTSKPIVKRRKTTTPPPATTTRHMSHSEILEKAREAVTKRFIGMFHKLLTDNPPPDEEGSVDEISTRWSKKLEEDLYDAYHDLENGRVSKDYKEVSTRIFVNVKDEKNTKLRTSIINRHIPFEKLVRMPVNELLNPDLRKEKEEAIKESMTQATLEKATVSNIRRTHKGDILIENEDSTVPAQFDFNVGMHLDGDDKKFVKSQDTATIKHTGRSNSLYDGPYDDDEDDHDHDHSHNHEDHEGQGEDEKHSTSAARTSHHSSEHGQDNNDGREGSASRRAAAILDDDDDDLFAILGETKKKIEETVDMYDPNAVAVDTKLWEGQTIFTGVTNFDSTVNFKTTTLAMDEFNVISRMLLDSVMPMEIEGRLDGKKADAYLAKVADSRKLVLVELRPKQEGDNRNFKKLYDYFHSKAKFGVIVNKLKFIKDVYLVPFANHHPQFFSKFDNFQPQHKESIFVAFVLRQEMIPEVSKQQQQQQQTTALTGPTNDTFSSNDFEFLSALGPNELAIVQRIFDNYPRARTDPVFLIQQLQQMINGM